MFSVHIKATATQHRRRHRLTLDTIPAAMVQVMATPLVAREVMKMKDTGMLLLLKTKFARYLFP